MYHPRGPYVTMAPQLTPVVKYLIIACAGVFLLQSLSPGDDIELIFGLTPSLVLGKIFLWQLGTYIFLHGHFWHIFMNLFILWMFGPELERVWGRSFFLKFFFVAGVGAGVLSVILNPFSINHTIGASGSIYGILTAWWLIFPERLVYVYFLFPIKVKYFVGFLLVLAFLAALGSPGDGIDHVAHVGGIIFAFLYLKGWLSPGTVRQAFWRWRIRRMRERFKVYERQREEPRKEDDFWIN